MYQVSATRLLNAWEQGRRQSGVERAMLLLGTGEPEGSTRALASLPIGRRDARILDLRASVFGPLLDAVVSCPACGELLEFTMAAADIPLRDDDELSGTLSVSNEGYEVAFRLPTSEDLAAVAQQPGPNRRSAFVERCILEARRGNSPISVDAVPDTVVASMLDRMEESDPSTTLKISLSCPGCGHEWPSRFDIVSFLWAEVDAWAIRTLREVHTLASTYGWSEADILAMSAWRRYRYVEMVAV